ncbi:serine threonine- kinase 11-interacting [Brachionus plicatilis]|uniref:Serine threonine-kinase 11-interacting n=1 Tax=Brachionus plicatilis TaxID=10195 RepID=A0A3M7SL68_BRAPC|nr:serine threonine- kinase 11-interacting [Brachionus plicatilis]
MSFNKQNQNHKNYLMLVEFCKFLRQNGDKLFDKDSKLCLRSDQLTVLHEYLQQIIHRDRLSHENTDKYSRRKSSVLNLTNTKEFILLYQSNQLHFIQDFLFKITSLKITSNLGQTSINDSIRLNIFGSITYLELKNIPVLNIYDLENLRKQLETLIAFKSIAKVQDLIQSCGADQSSPSSWPKLNTLKLSYNYLSSLDDSFRLAASIEVLDLSHNNLKNCEQFLHNLPKLKRINLSFNKLEEIPSISESESTSQLEYLDLSYNNIEKINASSKL